MGGTAPAISLVIPVYNAEDFLANCLGSIVSQSFADFEIICVDDGSTDESAAIMAGIAATDSRITVLTQENLGASVARNRGVAAAAGEYLCFVDSDDCLLPDALENLYQGVASPRIDIACGGYLQVDRIQGRTERRALKPTLLTGPDCLRAVMTHDVPWTPWAKLMRRELFANHDIRFPEQQRNANDYPAIVRVFHHAATVKQIRALVYQRVHHRNSLTTSWDQKCSFEDRVRARVLLRQWLCEIGRWDEFAAVENDSARCMFRGMFLRKMIVWARGRCRQPIRTVVDIWNAALPALRQSETDVVREILRVLAESVDMLSTFDEATGRRVVDYVVAYFEEVDTGLADDLTAAELIAVTTLLAVAGEEAQWSDLLRQLRRLQPRRGVVGRVLRRLARWRGKRPRRDSR